MEPPGDFDLGNLGLWEGATVTKTVATAPQKSPPELSDSLLNDPLWVNNRVPTAARKQPARTTPQGREREHDLYACAEQKAAMV